MNMGEESARDTSYRKLRRLLTCAGLQPGTRLAEVEWAERLGVHRGAVREAMAILLHEGLLGREGRSFVVPVINEADVHEIYEVRKALEISALRLSAGRDQFDQDVVSELVDLCQVMEHLLKSDLYFAYSETDAKFHNMLVKLSGNQRLERVYQSAPLPHAKYGGVLPDDIDQVLKKAQIEHEQIACCVRETRILDAIPVLEEHLSVDWWVFTSPHVSVESAADGHQGEVSANV